jgi:hypothetical protein
VSELLYREFPIQTRRGKIVFPPPDHFPTGDIIGSNLLEGWAPSLLIRCPNPEEVCHWPTFYRMICDWCSDTETDHHRYRMYGVFGCQIFPVRIDRYFAGITMYFVDVSDAVHMKLSLSDICDID